MGKAVVYLSALKQPCAQDAHGAHDTRLSFGALLIRCLVRRLAALWQHASTGSLNSNK